MKLEEHLEFIISDIDGVPPSKMTKRLIDIRDHAKGALDTAQTYARQLKLLEAYMKRSDILHDGIEAYRHGTL